MEPQVIFGISVFVICFILISSEKISKTVTAMAGASIFLATSIISQERAFEEVDWNVVFLLISMMLIVGITKETGLFEYVAIKMAKIAKGSPFKIMLLLCAITAVFSAFLDNVTTVLILTPITILIAVELGLSPIPFILAEIMASNIGGTATLIGDPPNIMIGSAAHLSFLSFIQNISPVIIVILGIYFVWIYFVWGKDMHVSNQKKARIMEFDEKQSLKNQPLLIKCLSVIGLVIIGFLGHSALHLEAATISLVGASLLMLLTGEKHVEKFFHDVEWETIFFFIGLFILVGGLVELGVINWMAQSLLDLTAGNITTTSILILWSSGVLSGLVDNIPYVATMIPLVEQFMQDPSVANDPRIGSLWWSLALGACLGGNATLIGASANVVAAGIASKNGYKISFLEFTKYGSVITVISLAVSTGYLLLFFL